jgi:hypothetical protein
MPALGKFGFHFAIKRAYIEQPGNGFIYSFDRANHKVRIWLGAAQAALTIAANTQTGNVAATPAASGGTPAGNLANLAAGAFTGDAATPTGNVANSTNHSHDLLVAGNGVAPPVDMVGVNGVNLCANVAANATILGADAANKGGVLDKQVAAGAFTGDAKTPTGNVANGTGAFVGAALGTHVHGAQTFTGDSHTHTVTGGGLVAEAALAEMDAAVVLAASTHILYMEMVGR